MEKVTKQKQKSRRPTRRGKGGPMGETYSHRPVLLHECIEALNIRPDGVYLDGTLMSLIGNYAGSGDWGECTWWRFKPKN